MEVVPNAASLEVAPQPNLLEAYAEREVTLFGITATFKDLAGMCPVDLDDPRITLEAKNEFVAKAANEAGLAIEPEHEAVFAKVIEKHGLERKFTIAEPAKTPVPDDKPTEKISPIAHTREIEIITPKPQYKQAKQPVETVVLNLNHAEPAQQHPAIPEIPIAAVLAAEEVIYNAALRDRVQAERAIYETQIQPAVSEALVISTEAAAVKLDADMDAERFVANEVDSIFADTAFDALLEELSTISPSEEYTLEPLPAITEEIVEIAEVGWATELTKEPLELYKDFTATLTNFIETSQMPDGTSEDDVQLENGEFEAIEPVLPILAAIADRLSELKPDEQELVAPILQNIVGAIHAIQLLETKEMADPEAIAAVEAQLEELCMTLFEALGIEYEEQSLKQLMRIMLHPEFQPPQPLEPELDLEHMGTREVKHHFPAPADDSVNTEGRLQHLLGTVALLCVRINIPELALQTA